MLPRIVHQVISHITRLRFPARHVDLLQPVIILQGFHPEIRVFGIQILFEQLFPLLINPIVNRPHIQDKVKDIIAGDNPALRRYPIIRRIRAHPRIVFKEISPVKTGIPVKPQLFRDTVENRRLPRSVASIKKSNRLKIQHPQPVL